MRRWVSFLFYLSILGFAEGCGQETNEEPNLQIIAKPANANSIEDEQKGTQEIPEFKGMHVVTIKGMKFIPAELTISKGDTVVWINKDISIHNVADEKDGLWQSPELERGDYWKYAMETTTEYYCSLHKVMKGKIIVR